MITAKERAGARPLLSIPHTRGGGWRAECPSGPFTLPSQPYTFDALEPYIDAKTIETHRDKHYRAYVTNLDKAIAAHPELSGLSVEALVKNLATVPKDIRTAVRRDGKSECRAACADRI